jgi:hypothetical protein
MSDKQHGLSNTVRQIVERLFREESFKEDALANPELAFATYSLDTEERQALKGLLGNMGSRNSVFDTKPKPFEGVWL